CSTRDVGTQSIENMHQEKGQERHKTAFIPGKEQPEMPVEVIALLVGEQLGYAFPALSGLIFKEEEAD
ncbi:hypothetical protein ACV35H_33715, partial [Pseudomonas aeruginosa]